MRLGRDTVDVFRIEGRSSRADYFRQTGCNWQGVSAVRKATKGESPECTTLVLLPYNSNTARLKAGDFIVHNSHSNVDVSLSSIMFDDSLNKLTLEALRGRIGTTDNIIIKVESVTVFQYGTARHVEVRGR